MPRPIFAGAINVLDLITELSAPSLDPEGQPTALELDAQELAALNPLAVARALVVLAGRPVGGTHVRDGVYGKVRLAAGEDSLVAVFDTDTGRHLGSFPVVPQEG